LASLPGLRPAEPGEFTRRAFVNGRIDLTEAEGLADLIEAETESQRKTAIAVAEGGLRKQVAEWQERLLLLSAEAERSIDYDDEDGHLPPALRDDCAELERDLQEWLDRPPVERLKDGIRVVVAGPPNSGKSSLINVIAGEERAIVTDIPGTTRDHIEVPLALDGVPLLLTDTAGLRVSADEVEIIGVARAARLIEAADLLVWLGDADNMPDRPQRILVHSRADLPGRETVPDGALAVSAHSGLGLAELLKRIGILARSLLPSEGAIALNQRQRQHLEEAVSALSNASASLEMVIIAEDLRLARSAFDRLTGKAGVEDVLDALFSRFCLGK
jgi:tRNA modification GTPase